MGLLAWRAGFLSYLIVPTHQRGNATPDAPVSGCIQHAGRLSLLPSYPNRCPSPDVPSPRPNRPRSSLSAMRRDSGGIGVLEWWNLSASVLQYEDAGASNRRSHAGAWERSKNIFVKKTKGIKPAIIYCSIAATPSGAPPSTLAPAKDRGRMEG